MFKRLKRLTLIVLYLLLIDSNAEAIKRKSPLHSDVIEEVEAKRLDSLLDEQDFIAVFFCKSYNLLRILATGLKI